MVLEEIGIKVQQPICIIEDNEVTINLDINSMMSTHRNLIDLRHHVIHYYSEKGTIKLQYVPTSSMISDMFTKCSTRPSFERVLSIVMTINTHTY